MDELISKSKEIIQENLRGNFEPTLVELLSDAFLAILLIKPTLALDKLPGLIRKLDIIADRRKVIDMAHEELDDYMEDEYLKMSNACVVRQVVVNDSDELVETRHLLVSLSNVSSYTEIICVLIHELIHLLRFSWSNYDTRTERLKTKEGISVNIFDVKNQQLKRKNQFLEEGIVQFYTNMAVEELTAYISDIDVTKIKTLEVFKKEIYTRKFETYLIQTTLLEKLSFDMRFRELLDETFSDTNGHSRLEKYFNEVMGSNSAFADFSKSIDRIYISLANDRKISSEVNRRIEMMRLSFMVHEYFSHLKRRQFEFLK